MAPPTTGLPIVAIVGRPNVGKSTLFNRIVGGREAIVEDRARTTRDRLYGEAEWNGRRFVVVDTGGLETEPGDDIEAKVQEQARLAIAEADVICFVVDAISGLNPADAEAAEILRSARAPVLVAANKADNNARELESLEFHQLGWERLFPVAAIHGRGVADLLDELVLALPPESAEETARGAQEAVADEIADVAQFGPDGQPLDESEWALVDAGADEPPAIAFVGRPNVGKSSLLNALLGEERMIVSDIPGTTRDAIDTRVQYGRTEVVLIDTAGIKRRGKVASGPAAERYSTLRSLRAIGRADVAVVLIDGVEGLTAQDAHIAGYVVEEGRGLVVAVNKWDAVEAKTGQTFDRYSEWIRNEAPFLDFAPIVSISAKTGQRVARVLELAVDAWGERRRRIPTAELNRVIAAAGDRANPPAIKGRRPKILYATQVGVAPPTFVLFGRDVDAVHFSYRRFLENRIRDEFGFLGTPIRLVFRERPGQRAQRRAARGGRGSGRGTGRAGTGRAGERTGRRG
jgi:GTP-binding protein